MEDIAMPRTLTDIFNDNPDVEVIEVVGYNDGGPFGLSSGGRKLKILDDNFAGQLAKLPGANTEAGHITDEGYCIHGDYVVTEDRYKASVYRLDPRKSIR
jgi:hypothetical protein